MRALLLLVLSTGFAFAQSFTPTLLVNQVFTVEVSSGTGPFSTFGTAAVAFTGDGRYYIVGTTGDIGEDSGTYAYTRQTNSQARLILDPGMVYQMVYTIKFDNALGGTFTATTQWMGGGTQTGKFSLSPFSASAPLVNLSTRATLGAGQVLNPGFVISGSVPRTVLIRGIGPALGAFQVPNPMPDPKLTLFNGANQVIVTNDNWQAIDAPIFDRVGAFALGVNSRDAVIVATLPPGRYSAVLDSAVTGESGEVLLEVYFVE